MSYQIEVSRPSEKDIRRLSPEMKTRIVVALRALADEPRPGNVRKLSGDKDEYRIRVGDYRVIYEVLDRQQRVVVRRIRHRREVYRG